jgi:hemoglobin
MIENERKTIYEKLGGEPAIEAAVDIFYSKVLDDPELMGFFSETNMTFQKSHQKKFITYLTGGSNSYEGKDMRTAHKHLKLSDEHFDAIKNYLADTLFELNVPHDLVNTIGGTVETLRNDILNR